MSLTAEQRQNIKRALGVASSMHVSPRVEKALVEAMGVESDYRHLNYGDRDSVGILQQRPSQGWGPASDSLETDVRQFLQRAIAANRGFKGSAGSLAQSVQRSAFPDRYDQRGAEADSILGRMGGGGSHEPTGTGSTSQATTAAGNVPDLAAVKRQLLYSYLQDSHNPDALLSLAQGMRGLRAQEQDAQDQVIPAYGGNVHQAGKPKWDHSKLYELFYNGQGGVNADNGQRVGMGYVEGHTDHVHVAAPTKKLLRLARLATHMGLNVREFAPYDKVDPVHKPNSFHYRNEAMDVSGDPNLMRRFDRKVARRFGL